jgi:protoheme IX farnesyltransferase
MSKVKSIVVELFKLKQTVLLVLTGVFAYLIAAGRDSSLIVLAKLTISMFLTISGTTGFNMVLDRDIDALMFRTRSRPLPDGRLSVSESLFYSMITLMLGLLIACWINVYVLIAGLTGFLIDILLYTYLLKRKTWISVLIGGIAGGAPAFGGYIAYPGASIINALFFMLIVSLWATIHIWFISTYYKEDYVKAKIPMLPVVKGEKITAIFSLFSLVVIITTYILLFLRKVIGLVTVTTVLMLSLYLLTLIHNFYKNYSDKWLARRIYKFLNIYLGLTFVVGFLERTLL